MHATAAEKGSGEVVTSSTPSVSGRLPLGTPLKIRGLVKPGYTCERSWTESFNYSGSKLRYRQLKSSNRVGWWLVRLTSFPVNTKAKTMDIEYTSHFLPSTATFLSTCVRRRRGKDAQQSRIDHQKVVKSESICVPIHHHYKLPAFFFYRSPRRLRRRSYPWLPEA